MFTKSQLEFLQNKKLALACSGGVDSMVLAHLLLSHGFTFDLIHCNFQLRGEASNLDEDFVHSFAKKNKLRSFVKRFDTTESAKKNQTSIEIEARNVRYEYFEELIRQENIDLVLLAHHRNDQAETIFMRLIKGAGFVGLSGMKELRDYHYYRPLLNISKGDILSYSIVNEIQHREDETNKETIYQRNKIRNQILPLIEEINPSYQDALIHLGNLGLQTIALLEDNFSHLKNNWQNSGEVDLTSFTSKNYLSLVVSYILDKEIIHKEQVADILKALMSKESKIFKLRSYEIEVKNFIISIIREANADTKTYMTIDEILSDADLRSEIKHTIPKTYLKNSLYFDINKVKFPIHFRPMQTGDKMKPFGLQGQSKKLSDIAQELNWTANEKLSNNIIIDGDSEIIAILSYRVSEKVKIDYSSHQILIIQRP